MHNVLDFLRASLAIEHRIAAELDELKLATGQPPRPAPQGRAPEAVPAPEGDAPAWLRGPPPGGDLRAA
ncbi:hypothetical protein [Poseidonocella sp. HB161398]|uniref:hypothetical protein n=1 Tax=Poseidonocella sp. HB161398 TaxID=2320855 RepID=UPI001109E856|nr:hypothetical protein [Poseidonocella sp. HB161398]